MAIVLDGRVLEDPMIMTPILGGGLEIIESPHMTVGEAKAIVGKLMADSAEVRGKT